MGKFLGKAGRVLFGGPEKKKSDQWNNAWPGLNSSLSPATGYVTEAGGMLSKLLGGSTEGANAFANSGGMRFLQDQSNKMINSNKAARGLLKSGSTLTALQDRGYDLHKTYLNDYIKSLLGFGDLGLGAAGVLSDAGKASKSREEGKKKGIISTLIKAFAPSPGGG